MYSSDTINIAAENKRKNRQPEYCVRRPFKVCDGCVEATLGITTVTAAYIMKIAEDLGQILVVLHTLLVIIEMTPRLNKQSVSDRTGRI